MTNNNEPGNDSATANRLVPAGQSVPVQRDPYGPIGGYGPPPAEGGPSLVQILHEVWRILNKRKWLIASIALSFVVIGAVRTMMITPLYTSSVRLQIDRNAARVMESGNVTPVEGYDAEFLRTHYELLQSRSMAERVASALRLGEDMDFFKPRQFTVTGYIRSLFSSPTDAKPVAIDKALMERAAAGMVMGNRAVRPIPGSRLVDVVYSDTSPDRAQRIAQAYAEAFIASNLDKRFQANSYAKTFLEDQVQQLKARLEASERAMLEFAEKEQIVVVSEKASIAENNLASANASLGAIIAERIKNEQLWRQLERSDAINVPQLLTNTVIDGLRARRNTLVTEYQEKLETFKPAYPAMVQISNKIKEIDRQLASEVQTIRSSLKAAYESSLSQEKEMRKRIEELRGEVLDLQKRSIQHNILKREVDSTRSLYNGLLQRFKEVDVAGGVGVNNVFIVDKATRPGGPSSPNLSRAMMLSLMIGLGAGAAAAYLLERLDDTIRTSEEVERVTGLVTLGVIPKVGKDANFEAEIAEPRSAISEAYRSLCTGLQFSTDQGLPKTLLITSAGPAEGKSSTAMAVAKHFATMGNKVLLIDADLRNPSLHVKLGRENAVGLSNYLTGTCSPPDAFQRIGETNVWFMPSGVLPPNAADLLASPRLMSLLSVGMEVFDFIVIDGPPVMGLADAPILSNAALATVFITGAGQARLTQVRAALRRLQTMRAPVIGTVLTKFDAKAAGYGYGYGYGDSYGFGYSYGGAQQSPGPAQATNKVVTSLPVGKRASDELPDVADSPKKRVASGGHG
jgi:capsular exopolysaccharide synthesis family protein